MSEIIVPEPSPLNPETGLRFLSVCSGIEAASVAWHPLGWRALAFSEIEPFPRAVLAHHYPDVPLHGDFTKLRDEPWIVDADILAGGTPCQAFSIAGLRNSLADERGNLTLEFVRLFDAIDDLRLSAGREPAVCFWENVPGVLSTKDNAFGCFLAALVGEDAPLVPGRGQKWTDAGLVVGPRRTAAWRTLDAQYFGLAQRRRRVFVVASARNGFDPAEVLFERQGVQGNPAPRREAGEGFAHGFADGSVDGIAKPLGAHALSKGRGTDLDNTTYVGTVPFDTTQITSAANYSSPKPGDPCHPLAAGAHAPAVAYAIQERAVSENLEAGPQGKGYQAEVAYTLEARHHVQACAFALRGRDAGSVPEVNGDGQSVGTLRACEGGSSRDYVAEVAPTISARSQGGGGLGTDFDCDGGLTGDGAAVRRLTPVECERLQGFPDGYTLIPWRGKPSDQCPDGPRYKALGNSWAVPVVRWIGARLDAHLATPAGSGHPEDADGEGRTCARPEPKDHEQAA